MAIATATGKVSQIIGPVVDVEFEGDELPDIFDALEIAREGTDVPLTLEVEQNLGNGVVRCIAMDTTEGQQRGAAAKATGQPITVPVGRKTLGRMFNVTGDPIDGMPQVEDAPRWPIHRRPPSVAEQETSTQILETGIKVIDLI